MERVARAGLRVERVLADFLEERALPGSGVEPGAFWAGSRGVRRPGASAVFSAGC